MAKKILLLLLLCRWIFALPADPGAASLKISSAGGKKVRIALDPRKRMIDLSNEVLGCTELFDPAAPGRRIHDAARIGIVDWVHKGRRHYVVFWALANANCNVQGHCGAGENCTLLWLQLDAELRLEKKQAVVVQDCMAATGVPDMDLEEPGARLLLKEGRLDLRFGDLVADNPSLSRLVYERAACEKGLVVTPPTDEPRQ